MLPRKIKALACAALALACVLAGCAPKAPSEGFFELPEGVSIAATPAPARGESVPTAPASAAPVIPEVTAQPQGEAEPQSTTEPPEPSPTPAHTPAPKAEEEEAEKPAPTKEPPRPTKAPEPAGPSLTKQAFTADDGFTLSYWLYTPKNAGEDMPLIVYLHGGSGKGDNLDALMEGDGFPKYLKEGKFGDIPAYVAMPQAPSSCKGWADIKGSVRDLVKHCIAEYGVNGGNVGLTGHSMGGTGTWSLALAFPGLFSRAAPMSGSVRLNDGNIRQLEDMPVWAFVGSADTVVSPDSSLQFVEKLREINPSAKITVLEGADHFAVPGAYLEYDVIGWLIGR